MDENDYFQAQEDAETGKALNAAVRAVLGIYEADYLSAFQRRAYRYSECGVSVGFAMANGPNIWTGDLRATNISAVDLVEDICISSIVEGSDAEVPPVWLGLVSIADGSHPDCQMYPDDTVEQLAIRRWTEALAYVEAEADGLWREANAGEWLET
jgi:hypothetical protein